MIHLELESIKARIQKCGAGHTYWAMSPEYPCMICECAKHDATIARLEAENAALKADNNELRVEHDRWVDILNESKEVVIKQREERIALRVRAEQAEKELAECAEVRFVRHIESHLNGDQVVMCKICGKTIFEIMEAK